MGAYNVITRASMAAGQPEDISVVLANFDAIAAILNGGLDNSNINVGAAILASKLANYPTDPLKVLKGDGSWSGPAKVANTVAGLGAASDGTLGIVRCGLTPFEFVHLIYDGTYGKWVSPEFPLYSGNGAWNSTDGTTSELRQVFGAAATVDMATSMLRGKPMTDAGLQLQLRVIGQALGTSSAAFTTQVFGRLNQANLGDALYTLLTSSVVSVNIAGTANSTFKMIDSGWASGPVATKDILIPTITFDSGVAQTVRFIGALRGRWVG